MRGVSGWPWDAVPAEREFVGGRCNMARPRDFVSPEIGMDAMPPSTAKPQPAGSVTDFEQLIASRSDVLTARIEPEDLREPEFLQALVYWHIKRGSKPMPARADLSPADMVKVLPKVVLIDVLSQFPHFRYRVCGTNIVDWLKFDATGQTLDSVKPEKYRRMLFATYMECIGARTPIAHRIFWNSEEIPHRYKRLTMPLASDGRNVDMLLVISLAEGFEEASNFWNNNTNATRY